MIYDAFNPETPVRQDLRAIRAQVGIKQKNNGYYGEYRGNAAAGSLQDQY